MTTAFLVSAMATQTVSAANEEFGTGDLPPTASDIAWMNANARRVGSVRLNNLGLDRLNADRLSLGLPVLTLPTVPHGLEVVPPSLGFSAQSNTTTPLPSSVDNSTLPYFPPICNQGSIGSCVGFATTYYMGTHMLGLARGINSSDPADMSTKLSPKWTYNLLNGGKDEGLSTPPTLELLLKNGAPSWADFPYSGSGSVSANYLEWSRDAAVWRNAVKHRFESAGEVTDLDTTGGRNQLKSLLSNGYVCVFSTHIRGWQYRTISNDPAIRADDAFSGKRICAFAKDGSFGHKMTVVGYNDHIWVDLNRNNQVDSGEKGAFRIANSWGTNWEEDGFSWLCYDALKATSAVAGADNTDRFPAWGNKAVQYIVARSSYTPSLLGEFTLNSARRSQIKITMGRSTAAATTPSSSFLSGAFLNQGGNFGFSGTASALNGSFVMDLTDLVQGSSRYYLSVADNAAGNPVNLLGFKITSAAGKPLGNAAIGTQGRADNSTARVFTSIGLNALDDVGNTASTAKLVTIPGSHSGSIEIIDDQDVYRFVVGVASNVTISTSGNLDTAGSLHSQAGTTLASNDDANGSQNFLINRNLEAGTYFIIVKSHASQSAGDYSLILSATPLPAAHMAISSQNGLVNVPIADGATAPLAINNTLFSNVTSNGAVSSRTFSLRSTGTGNLVLNGSPAVQLSGTGASSFRVIAQPVTNVAIGGSTSFRIEYAPDAPGTHNATVSITSNDVSTSPFTFAIRGTATFPRDDHGDSFERGTRVARPSTTVGNINGSADTDCFAFALLAPTTVTIRSTGTTDTAGALFSSTGALLAGNDNTSNVDKNFKIQRQLPAGIYFVKVVGQTPTVIGNYSLRIE